jgi:hypothetical protein
MHMTHFNLSKLKYTLIATISLFLLASMPTYATEGFAPVEGFARGFIFGEEIAGATITVLETGLRLKTDAQGKFGPFLYPIGKPITLTLAGFGYKTTQSSTQIVPPEGLVGPYQNITFQVPSLMTYYLLAHIIGAEFDSNSCHVVTTILAKGKTMDDAEQGEPNAIVTLSPYVSETPFYFDIFTEGPLKGKTNPFTKGLTVTTKDGGVGFFNLPPRESPYTISAQKDGNIFTQAQFLCRKNTFVNISPPLGPMAQF